MLAVAPTPHACVRAQVSISHHFFSCIKVTLNTSCSASFLGMDSFRFCVSEKKTTLLLYILKGIFRELTPSELSVRGRCFSGFGPCCFPTGHPMSYFSSLYRRYLFSLAAFKIWFLDPWVCSCHRIWGKLGHSYVHSFF